MAEEAQFLMRKGKVIHVQDLRMIGKDEKFQKQVGGFTIETSREWKDKTFHDYITFDCEGKVMAQYPSVGDDVEVEFTIGGTKWKNKEGRLMYFNKLRAYKVTTAFKGNKQTVTPSADDLSFLDANSGSDLPF